MHIIVNLKFLLQPAMTNLTCLMDHILFQTFKIILNTLLKKHETITNNPPVQISVNKIKNRIVFKIKIHYKLELLSLETLKLSESTYFLKLEFADAVLVHGNLVKNNYQQATTLLFTFVPNKQFGQLITIAPYSLTIIYTNTTNEYNK